jgi:predicted 2-oxoglutarate/Fe(II)-dependent dioxygenase YbiX
MEIYKNIFSNDFCDNLIEKIKNECVLSESHKTDWYVWLIWGQSLTQPLNREKWNEEIYNTVINELDKCNFPKHKIMWLQMTEYKDGRWLRRHVDTAAANKTSIMLLSNEFIGGNTYINDRLVKLEKGDAVLFNGSREFHEIKPVTDGTRYALNFWFYK